MSWTKPTNNDVQSVLNALVTPQQESYFFERLKNPLWIEPLAEHEAFAYPPGREALPNGGVRFPIWPATRYLARMAKDAPVEVAKILAAVKTDNPSIVGDMISAALAMPAADTRDVVGQVIAAAKADNLWMHFGDAVDLCLHLAKGAEWDLAIGLVESMFQPKDHQAHRGGRDEYWYSEGLKRIVLLFAVQRWPQFSKMLMGWLAGCSRAATSDADLAEDDFSWSWRPAIEEHEQNRHHGNRSILAGFVRVAFETAIEAGAVSIDTAVESLRAQRMLVFERIALYLIAAHAPKGGPLAVSVVRDLARFDDYRTKHEYSLLLRSHFGDLQEEDSAQWFEWVEAGPDMTQSADSLAFGLGRPPTSEELQARSDYWKFSKLHIVREHLTGERRTFYERMHSRHGEPELAEFSVSMSHRWGAESPMTVEQLSAVSFEATIQLVNAWRPAPGDRGWGPSVEGLVATFRQFLQSNARGASSRASALIGSSPVFVRAFVAEMTQAVKQGSPIDVVEVLRLCQWIVAQPTERLSVPAAERSPLVDKDWQWSKDECARFVEAVCTSQREGASAFVGEALRESLWGVVIGLREAAANCYIGRAEPTDDLASTDYISISLNSSRGMAVNALLAYARWVGNQVAAPGQVREGIPGDFDNMPEVRELLDWHLANPSIQAAASIGLRLGLLYWLDERWLRESVGRLFAPDGDVMHPVSSTGWAAWNAFVVGARPHVAFYRMLRPQFEYILTRAAAPRPGSGERENPLFHFAQFVLTLYGRGDLALDEDDGFIRRLLQTAHPSIRRHGIEFVGKTLQDSEDVPSGVVDRFRDLWDYYWSCTGISDAKERRGAWLFGLWFATGQFESSWSLDALGRFIGVAGLPEPDHAVVERLAALIDEHPVKVARLLRQIVDADVEGWHVHGWMEDARTILRKALAVGGEAAAEARRAIETLGRRGYVDFGKLLKQP
jgi:hypothetical protein